MGRSLALSICTWTIWFVRVSRQHIINLRFVRKIEPWFDGGLLPRLGETDPEIKVARRRAPELRERLSL